jgi:hypothetical protein
LRGQLRSRLADEKKEAKAAAKEDRDSLSLTQLEDLALKLAFQVV